MDPLSVSASAASLLTVVKDLAKWGYDFYKAKKGYENQIARVRWIEVAVDSIQDRLLNAQKRPDEPGNRVILEKLDPVNNPQSSLAQLQISITKLSDAPGEWSKVGFSQRMKERLLYHWKKEEVGGMFEEIHQSLNGISIILDQGHQKLSEKHFEVSQEQLQYQESQYSLQKAQNALLADQQSVLSDGIKIAKDTGDRVETIETHQDAHMKVSRDTKKSIDDTNVQVKELTGQIGILSTTVHEERLERLRRQEVKRIRAIETWLSPLEFQARQRDLINECFPTGRWLLESKEYQTWFRGAPWQLRCCGKTGTGKTHLSALVCDDLKSRYATDKAPVLCIFFSQKESANLTARYLIGSLLKQLLQLNQKVSPMVGALFDKNQSIKAKASLTELGELFKSEIETYERVYLIVDALNECQDRSSQRFIEETLVSLLSKNLSLMITSTGDEGRLKMISCSNCEKENLSTYFHCDICSDGDFDLCNECMEEHVGCHDPSHTLRELQRVEIEVKAEDDEIRAYVRSIMNEEMPKDVSSGFLDQRVRPKLSGASRLARNLAKEPKLLDEIPDAVARSVQGNFLLAQLYMESLTNARTLKEIKDELKRPPKTWDMSYEKRMNERVLRGQRNEDDRDLALNILSLLTCAGRPLTLAELQHALSIKTGETNYDLDDTYDRDEILEVTKGFLSIDDGDPDRSYVRFYHLTAQNYLDRTRDKWFPNAENKLAIACLNCFNYDMFAHRSDNEDDLQDKLKNNPFARYALVFWGDHVRKAQPDEALDELTLQFLKDDKRLSSYIQAAWSVDGEESEIWDVRRDIDPLHVCAWFGLSRLILKLGLDNYDVNVQEKTYGQTPLMYACRRGHLDAARQLLDLGADPNVANIDGTTALFASIRAQHIGVFDLLMANDKLKLDQVAAKYQNRTALMLAVDRNFGHAVDALVKRSTAEEVNMRDSKGITALSLAAVKGQLDFLNTLLSKPGIDLNAVDSQGGRSAMMLAASFAPEEQATSIIETLLDHGADPNLHDYEDGGTALSRAIESRRIDVTEALLECDRTDVKCLDVRGRSLMHYATHHRLGDILVNLKEKGVYVNMKDSRGFTPLHEAASMDDSSSGELVDILLDLSADPDEVDNAGRTPAMLASQYGHTTAAQLLSSRSKTTAIPQSPAAAAMPIWRLVQLGHADAVIDAIRTGKADIAEKEPSTGYGLLNVAVEASQTDVLRLLVRDFNMDPNSVDYLGMAPIHLAALKGRKEAIKVLLESNANMELRDHLNRTALMCAEQNAHLEIALSLIEAGAAIDERVSRIQALFFMAIAKERVDAVKILLEHHVDPLAKNEEGLVARQLAKRTGNVGIIRLVDSSKSFFYRQDSANSILSMPSPPSEFTLSWTTSQNLGEEAAQAELEDSLQARLNALKPIFEEPKTSRQLGHS